MEGIKWNDLTEDEKDTIREALAYQAEEEGLQREYGDLIAMYEEVDRRNQEFARYFCKRYDENMGDC